MRYLTMISLVLLGTVWSGAAVARNAQISPLPHVATEQVATASPVGDWLTGRGGAVVRISACADGGGLCGRIVGLVLDHGATLPTDYQGRPQCGFTLIRPSAPGADGVWHGRIVDPRNGNAYHAEFHVTADGELALRGYLGLPIFGQTQHWMRFDAAVPQSCRINQAQIAQTGTSANRND